MKHITLIKQTLINAALMLIILSTVVPPTSASPLDLLFGRAAVPGSELHALGTAAISQNHGDATYFTNGKGRVLEVRARTTEKGILRVSVNRVYIPRNYNGSAKSETIYDRLSQLATEKNAIRAGSYTMIDETTGWRAYLYGKQITKALDSE
ncbi:hypothetical protein [Desulfoluna spongiiphila]|uniref:Uncharacterized protein n=1 Tax=Desulfoluna spongiiphila TaxID=419481 RepID=A0A1G5F450_9BACT|nr:hypothetical protein [Desulfoluna spongiiphila]SCY34056.1 hypothetical protein SAMN05216233_107129 [Desulfoluna spongiiphila]